MKRLILLLAGISLFMACDDEIKEDTGVPVLTVEVERNAFRRNEQKWIYISDASGTILDSEMVRMGTFTLNAKSLPEFVDVTVYTIIDLDPARQHQLVTFVRVPAGKTYKFKKQPVQFNSFPPVGSIRFEVDNYPMDFNLSTFNISNGNPMVIFPTQVLVNNNKMTGFYAMTSSKADLLFTNIRDGQRVYRWVEDVSINNLVNLDYLDFIPCEHTLELPYNVYGSAFGIRGESSYYIGSTSNSSFQNIVKLSYAEGFEYYSTQLHNYGIPRTGHFFKVGERVESVEFPVYQGFITQHGISNFNFSESQEYTYRTVRWHVTNHSVGWQIIGDDGPVTVKFLPKELKESFPDIELSHFHYGGQAIFKRMDGYTYTNYLDEMLGITDPPKFYEYYYVDVFQ